VILLLAKRLENLLFAIYYTSFGIWIKDHYISLQKFTMAHMSSFAKIVNSTTAMLRFSGVIRGTMAPLVLCRLGWITMPLPTYLSKTLPTSPLISKQAVPQQTCGVTYCSGGSTPKIRSLVDSSMTNHIIWWIPTVSTITNLAQTTTSKLTMVNSHLDGWKTNTLNTKTRQTQYHKDGRLARWLKTTRLSITNQAWNPNPKSIRLR
jgi:hypothetical protein